MKTLDEMQKYAEEVAGAWNGDEAGTQEERAHTATEILDKVKEIRELLNEL